MEKVVGDYTESELMDEVMDALAVQTIEDGEMTSYMLRKHTGLSERLANIRLEKLCKQGYLKKRRIVDQSHTCFAYSPSEGGWATVLEQLT